MTPKAHIVYDGDGDDDARMCVERVHMFGLEMHVAGLCVFLGNIEHNIIVQIYMMFAPVGAGATRRDGDIT